MAKIEVQVSDLSEEVIRNQDEAVTIEVEHPSFDAPVTLDALPQDLEGKLPEPQEVVSLTYNNQRYVLSVPEFHALFTGTHDPQGALERAYKEQHPGKRGRRGSGQRQRRPRIDYASPEHAGEPHTGRVRPAEQEYVREHLTEVNARLREQGIREIDPTDPEMAERYGLVQEPIDAQVVDEAPPEG